MAVEFLRAYPDIGLRLLLTDRIVNAVEENIDVAVRIGSLPEKQHDRLQDRIDPSRGLRESAYLAARGRPQTPDHLRDHDCIAINDVAASNAWKFSLGKRERLMPIQSRLCVNTSEAAVLAAIAGAGLTRVMSYKMDAARRAGSLELVLEPFEPQPLPVHIVLFAPQAGAAETPRLPQLGDAAPQSPAGFR